jgi:amidase
VPAELGGDNWTSMGENGPMATTVADAALGLSVMAGDPALARVDPPPGGVRIALVTGAPAPGGRVDRHWAGAARDVAGLLAGQGHQVEPAQLPVPVWAWRALHARWFAGAEAGAAAAGLGHPAMEARTRRHARAGRIARRLGWVRLEDTGRWREVLAPFFARHDVVLGPALAAPPVPAISWAQRGWWANYRAGTRYADAIAWPWNLAGWPSMTVPPASTPPEHRWRCSSVRPRAASRCCSRWLARSRPCGRGPGTRRPRPHPVTPPSPDRQGGARRMTSPG